MEVSAVLLELALEIVGDFLAVIRRDPAAFQKESSIGRPMVNAQAAQASANWACSRMSSCSAMTAKSRLRSVSDGAMAGPFRFRALRLSKG